MAVLTLRDFPDWMAEELRTEAKLAGLPLTEYCVIVFDARRRGGFSEENMLAWKESGYATEAAK